MAKEYFKENNVPFESIDVASNEAERKVAFEKSGQMGVPVIEIGNNIIVGFNRPKIAELLGLPE